MRLGEGETFGVVLVERHPALDRQPLPCSGCQRADLSDASTKQLLAGAGLSVPEDPSQPVRTIGLMCGTTDCGLCKSWL